MELIGKCWDIEAKILASQIKNGLLDRQSIPLEKPKAKGTGVPRKAKKIS